MQEPHELLDRMAVWDALAAPGTPIVLEQEEYDQYRQFVLKNAVVNLTYSWTPRHVYLRNRRVEVANAE
jgi:hypothetical protein